MTTETRQQLRERLERLDAVLHDGYGRLENRELFSSMMQYIRDLEARKKLLVNDLVWFRSRVENGEVKSKKTYERFGHTLSQIQAEGWIVE
jgi:hypothetical protein